MTRSFGWQFAGIGGSLWFIPLVQRVQALQPDHPVRPLYSKAIAKLNFDKHEEAEKAVLEELEKCEDDFDGWLLLAELYANHFGGNVAGGRDRASNLRSSGNDGFAGRRGFSSTRRLASSPGRRSGRGAARSQGRFAPGIPAATSIKWPGCV